jgi:hypothetical protein
MAAADQHPAVQRFEAIEVLVTPGPDLPQRRDQLLLVVVMGRESLPHPGDLHAARLDPRPM